MQPVTTATHYSAGEVTYLASTPHFVPLTLSLLVRTIRIFTRLTAIICLAVPVFSQPVGAAETALSTSSEAIDFALEVRPILSEHCFHCHGPDAATRQSDLRLDQAQSAAAVLNSENGHSSLLLQRIASVDDDERMPPPDSPKQLDADELAILTRWLQAGGDYQVHWAFATPQRPDLPQTVSDPWCNNPIDTFVLDRLQQVQLPPAVSVSPETLLRRVSYDLTGLPAKPDARATFLRDVEQVGLDVAYESLIDRLLPNPAYGEHMTLPWLEAARYADTDGYQNDRYRYQHAWRDWVLRAFNENLPYDQFITEQLAGDLLPHATLWQQVASGFGRNHRINSEDGSIADEWLTEIVVDRVDTLGTVFLGLTVGCARCHDHKYDPISQHEYYRLFAYFNSIAEHGVGPNNGNSPPFVELPASWPLLSSEEDRAREPEPVKLKPAREEAGNGLLRPQAGSPQTVMVMHELSKPRPTYLLVRGQYNVPDTSQPLSPNVPESLNVTSSPSTGEGSNSPPANRLELAQWLVGPHNPLASRVAVNRLWQQFFGLGLVESSDNFGSQGTPPSHPELLDWLAVEFIDSGWDVRHIQRLILLSSTYRQASQVSEESWRRDPKNRWLSRSPRLRLPAFVFRDQALAMSGLLVDKLGGPSVKPYMPADIWSSISNNKYVQDTGENLFRRSLYTYWRRTIPPPTMMNFNAAAREVCVVRTEATNTPLQALTLMNNIAFVESAKKLAERAMLVSTDGDPNVRIEYCFVNCLARLPSVSERGLLLMAHSALLENFQEHIGDARELLSNGEAPYDASLDCVELAALTMTASLIMNLDEAITKE